MDFRVVGHAEAQKYLQDGPIPHGAVLLNMCLSGKLQQSLKVEAAKFGCRHCRNLAQPDEADTVAAGPSRQDARAAGCARVVAKRKLYTFNGMRSHAKEKYVYQTSFGFDVIDVIGIDNAHFVMCRHGLERIGDEDIYEQKR